MADVLNGKTIDARLPILLTLVTKANVGKTRLLNDATSDMSGRLHASV